MTSLTQRSSGLVQRRTEASRSAAAADKERGAGGGPEDEGRRDESGDDEKGDSKETRLTLMEEVLLLGLKDREVRPGALGRECPRGHRFFGSAVGEEEPGGGMGSRALQSECGCGLGGRGEGGRDVSGTGLVFWRRWGKSARILERGNLAEFVALWLRGSQKGYMRIHIRGYIEGPRAR